MNPKKAYKFKKKIEITSVLLITFLISQIFFFINNDISFKVPNYIVEFISKRISTDNKFIVDKLFVKLNKTILLDHLRVDSANLKYEFSKIKIKYNSNFNFNFDNIKFIEIKKINVSKFGNEFYFEDILIQRIRKKIKYYFKHTNKFSSLNFSGTIDEDKILFLTDFINKSNNKPNNLISKLNKITETQLKKIPIETKKFQILINCNIDNDVSINIHQPKLNQNGPKYVNGLTAMLKFPVKEPQNMTCSLFIKNQNIYFLNTALNVVNFRLRRSKLHNQTQNPFHHYIIAFKEMNFQGKFDGAIKGFNTYMEEKNNTLKTLIIADSNQSRFSNELNFNSLDKKYKLSGTTRFIPKNFNLLYNDNNQSRKIIDGDEFSINFRNKNNLICLIDFNTINFSVLGSPSGDFEGNGMLDNNYSFKFPKSKVKMGNSNVEGSFSQKFSPLRYSFNISGICDPNDLNKWMGSWWRKIWSEFQFYQDSIPYGNFKIDGVWGQKDKTVLFGSVKTDDISFRNLKLKQTDITVKSDVNSTEISTPVIIHDFGVMRGSLKFSKNNHKLNSLTYHLDGNLPINDGTKVFGNIIEDYINDFNTSDININSSGKIPLQLNESNNTSTMNPAFEINFSTEQNGTWNGVFYDTFRGKIRSNDNNLTIHIPEIISEGTKLSFNAHINEDDKYSLSLNLKDAPFDKIINSVVDYESSSGKSISSNTFDFNNNLTSLVNLSFNGNGTLKDSSSIKGSGKISVNDKNLRQIHLLGKLSESLNILPIPLPIGTLNFNKLSGHFNLENDHIYFNDLSLTSLLSKLSSTGSINFNSGTINFTSDLNIIGNLFPIIDIIDPLSIISDIKLSGHWENPNWKIQLSEIK